MEPKEPVNLESLVKAFDSHNRLELSLPTKALFEFQGLAAPGEG